MGRHNARRPHMSRRVLCLAPVWVAQAWRFAACTPSAPLTAFSSPRLFFFLHRPLLAGTCFKCCSYLSAWCHWHLQSCARLLDRIFNCELGTFYILVSFVFPRSINHNRNRHFISRKKLASDPTSRST